MNSTTIDKVYETACNQVPYDYQRRLAHGDWPDLLNIPTGLGKTAAVTLSWVYKRHFCHEPAKESTPRRLIWCLPMRVLVEQTHENICQWLEALGLLGAPGEADKISVNLLMGGEENLRGWVSHPEQEQIIIGTQDMLLSRALMRGYGMSRYQWAVDFALLHNDAFWVFDEIQLMGAGLATSTQLEAFRRSCGVARHSRTMWVSATLNPAWLNTVDFRQYGSSLQSVSLEAADMQMDSVSKRLNAHKELRNFEHAPKGKTKGDMDAYLSELAKELLVQHEEGGPTLVVLNTVERAQTLAAAVVKASTAFPLLVVHSRFRKSERDSLSLKLRKIKHTDNTIIIATQAIEAGIDLSVARLFTELAPWSSMVQRFGRCNRGGEHQCSSITWIDLTEEHLALPYSLESLCKARENLSKLDSASPGSLPMIDEARPAVSVLRRKDLYNLFDTDPDISGFDIDISDYIREETQPPPVQVLWRNLHGQPEDDTPSPVRKELCPVSIAQIKKHLGKSWKAWTWDGLNSHWRSLRADEIRPGMTLMLDEDCGGYDTELGFIANLKLKKGASLALPDVDGSVSDATGFDPDTLEKRPVLLEDHLLDAEREAKLLVDTLKPKESEAVRVAALWHDVGKAHPVFQATLGNAGGKTLLAKSITMGRHSRKHFRHELASALCWLQQENFKDDEADLVAYLIAAHHGKVRMVIRAFPGEMPSQELNGRHARGIQDGDTLLAIRVGDKHLPETRLSLEIMELGFGDAGPSWSTRTQKLLESKGPFVLGWLESLVRIADWRASSQ